MRKLFFLSLGFVVLIALTAALSGSLGYYSHKLQLSPIFDLAERADRKGRRMLGMPTKTVGLVEQIDTTYLRMRGKSYLMPNNDFINGGALTVWGDDTLAMHRSGTIFYLDESEGAGLIKTGFTPPENGLAAYIKLAADKYPGRQTRSNAIRYNDVEFIETDERRGFAISYTFIDVPNECYRSRISWLPVPAGISSVRDLSNTPDDWELIFESNPCLEFNKTKELIVSYMAGGRIAFKAPNLLYLGNGEYHRDGIYRPDAGIQSDDSDYGKTIEINLDTKISRHYSKGHRNLQGITLDQQGRVWTTEHGMRGGDELNLILDGENYGWPLENLGTLYSGAPAPSISGVGRHDVNRAPVYAWLPSAAVSSITTVNGFHESWDGDLLIGSLRGQTLFRARIQGERLVFLEVIPIGQRIRDVMQVGPERIALWLDTNELVVLDKVERANPLKGMADALAEAGMSADMAEAASNVLEGCNECHSFEENVHQAGPSLHAVIGRDIASTAFADYSDALRSEPGNWNKDKLTAYLNAPGDVVEGTTMTGLGVGDPDLAEAVHSALEWLSKQAKDGGPGY